MKKVLVPKVRFKGFDNNWEQGNIGEVFELTRGEVLSQRKIRNKKMGEYIHPVFSSQTLNNGLLGFYNNFLFKNSITWTTDGANAGTVLYRDGLFYATNVCGVILQKTSIKPSSYFAHEINVKVKKHVIKAGNPKLMINVLHEVLINFSKNKLEQEKISILIENIDNLITLEQTKLNKLKKVKETLLEKMFPEHNSKKPRIRFKGFSEEWKEEKFGDTIEPYRLKNHNKEKLTSYSISNKFGFVNQKEFFENGGKAIRADKSNSLVVFPNSFAYNPARIDVGSIGLYTKEEKCLVSPIYEVFKTDRKMNDEFLFNWFKTDEFKWIVNKSKEGSVRNTVYLRNISDYLINITSYIEQQKIGDFFSKIDTLLDLYNSKLNKLKQIKEALLQKMFV
ncbi:restriction endonuclease subunit S [Mycoplasmopsis felis]|uniref:restriction endonuclease subunit S n=1 Tax=Mycoplasmopsis felis TaxID=33923 RepID=UPI003A4E4DED